MFYYRTFTQMTLIWRLDNIPMSISYCVRFLKRLSRWISFLVKFYITIYSTIFDIISGRAKFYCISNSTDENYVLGMSWWMYLINRYSYRYPVDPSRKWRVPFWFNILFASFLSQLNIWSDFTLSTGKKYFQVILP